MCPTPSLHGSKRPSLNRVNPSTEAISELFGKYKKFMFVHCVPFNKICCVNFQRKRNFQAALMISIDKIQKKFICFDSITSANSFIVSKKIMQFPTDSLFWSVLCTRKENNIQFAEDCKFLTFCL